MRFRKLITAATALGLMAAAACTSNAAQPLGSSKVSPAPVHQVPLRLHWDDGTGTIARPAKLEDLQNATAPINGRLVQLGFLAITEHVDDSSEPSVLVTDWLSGSGDVIVEVNSAVGVPAISFKRDTGDISAGVVWLRCTVTAKDGDFEPELNALNQKNADQLMKTYCTAVGV